MQRSLIRKPADRTISELADARELRAIIAASLAAPAIDEAQLRRHVWSYVGAERHAGTSAGNVILTLNELVDATSLAPASARQPLMRRVILWCVEAYFGHRGGDIVGRVAEAPADSSTAALTPPAVSAALDVETGYADWRRRLNRNYARVGDRLWEPLTHMVPPNDLEIVPV